MYAQLSVNDRGLGMRDYNLTGKDGLSLYIFRKEQGEWKCAYGYLDEDIKQAIIDALILRFDWTIKDLFLPRWGKACGRNKKQERWTMAYIRQ